MMRLILTLIALTALMMFSSGCGVYSFNPGGSSSIKSIAVNPFENETIEYGLSDRMTDLVVDAFITDGNLKVVPESDADAVLNGTLTNYDRKAYTYDENDIVSQYAIDVIFSITLNDPNGEEIWKESFTSQGIYEADNETEEDGQSKAAEKLVIDIINRTTKSW